jgi:hypothetical protein
VIECKPLPSGSFATVSPEFVCSRLNESFALEPFSSPFAEGSELYGFGFGQKFVDDDDCVLLNALRYEALECQAGAYTRPLLSST